MATLTLALEHSRVELPVRPKEATPAAFPIPIKHAEPPKTPPPPPEVATAPVSPGHYLIELDAPPTPFTWPDIGTTTQRGRWETCELTEGQPNSGRWRQEGMSAWARGDWDCSVTAVVELTSTATTFQVAESLVAKKAGAVIFERRSERAIPRRLV